MAKKKQKVVRWRKVLKHMGACGTLTEVYRLAGEPADLDGMVTYARGRDQYGYSQLYCVGFLMGLLGSRGAFRPRSRRRAFRSEQTQDLVLSAMLLWHEDRRNGRVSDDLVAQVKTILELESDARGLTEWI